LLPIGGTAVKIVGRSLIGVESVRAVPLGIFWVVAAWAHQHARDAAMITPPTDKLGTASMSGVPR
jgi:hypothetical protein